MQGFFFHGEWSKGLTTPRPPRSQRAEARMQSQPSRWEGVLPFPFPRGTWVFAIQCKRQVDLTAALFAIPIGAS